MAFDEETLRLHLGGVSETVLSEPQATLCLQEAVRAVSHRFGRIEATSFVTVADQQAYVFPNKYVEDDPYGEGENPIEENSIQDLIWHPSGSPLDGTFDMPSLYFQITQFSRGVDPLMLSLQDIHQRFLLDRSKGKWHKINGMIWLDPTPQDAGLKVLVLYRAYYELETIPDSLADMFWLCAKASALEKLAILDCPILEITDGSQKIRLDGGRSYLKFASELRARFRGGNAK